VNLLTKKLKQSLTRNERIVVLGWLDSRTSVLKAFKIANEDVVHFEQPPFLAVCGELKGVMISKKV